MDCRSAHSYRVGPTSYRGPADWHPSPESSGMSLFAHRFRRVEPRRHAAAFISTLLARLPRVNCWTAAEHAGHQTPDAFQNLLARAKWDHDGVRGDLRDYVVAHLGTDQAVLVLPDPVRRIELADLVDEAVKVAVPTLLVLHDQIPCGS